jgi:glycerol-3-phosphate acyltransferase PlsX
VNPHPAPAPLERVTLAVDCMGGDHGPAVTLPACRAFLQRHPGAELLLVGTADALAGTAGWARCTNPTLTLLTLSLRLADHLKSFKGDATL